MEGENYKPRDVVKQSGPNVGNIKDESLARVGAEAEDKERSKTVKHKVKAAIERGLYGNKHATADTVKIVSGDRAGEKSMAQEVGERAYVAREVGWDVIKSTGQDGTLLPGQDRKIMSDAASKDFLQDQNEKSFRREADKEKEKIMAEIYRISKERK